MLGVQACRDLLANNPFPDRYQFFDLIQKRYYRSEQLDGKTIYLTQTNNEVFSALGDCEEQLYIIKKHINLLNLQSALEKT